MPQSILPTLTEAEMLPLAPDQGDITIQIRKLYKHYGKTSAIRGIDLNIFRGELFGFIGPDGAGKTSTFNILGGGDGSDRRGGTDPEPPRQSRP